MLESMPKPVIVKFHGDQGSELPWRLPGLGESGLYPIGPSYASWYLDKGWQHPVLKIRRKQVPLTPAFVMTAHASQGQTFRSGAIVDLRLGGSFSATGSYVSMARVERREDLLIFGPFGKEPACHMKIKAWNRC